MLNLFKDFFVKLDLPYSIKLGEEFVLKATIYNYLKEAAETSVELFADESFEIKVRFFCAKKYMQVVLYDLIVSYAKDPSKANGRGTVIIPSLDTFTVTWIIQPTRIGEIPLKVRAKVKDGQAADTIVKNLLVKPNGIPKEISSRQWLTQCNRTDRTNSEPPRVKFPRSTTFSKLLTGKQELNLNVSFPDNIVSGTKRIELLVYGDVLANTVRVT